MAAIADVNKDVQSTWMTSLLDALAGPVNKDIIKDVYDTRPQTQQKDAYSEFIKSSASTNVMDFLNRNQATSDDSQPTADGEEFNWFKCYVYGILLHLTRDYTVACHVVSSGIVSQIVLDIQNNMNGLTESSTMMLVNGLAMITRCAQHPLPTMNSQIKDESLDAVLQLMRTQETNAILVYLCIQHAANLNDAVASLPPVLPDVISKWIGWMESCHYDALLESYSLILPVSPTMIEPTSNLFMAIELVVVTHDKRVALAMALQLQKHNVQKVFLNGDGFDKKHINKMLTGIINCEATCNLDFVRDILFNSGKSISDIIQMEGNTSNIKARFPWIAEHVPDIECCYKLAVELDLGPGVTKKIIRIYRTPSSITEYLLRMTTYTDHFPYEAVVKALHVIPVKGAEIDRDSSQQYKHILDQINIGQAYKMVRPIRGRAVIINNKMFADGEIRHGSEKDMDHLQELFGEFLQFQIKTYVDLTDNDFRGMLLNESEHDRLHESDAFVLVIMSHGDKTGIICKDGITVSLEEIVNSFSAGECPELAGKPKLLFIQACRGDQHTFGVKEASSEECVGKIRLLAINEQTTLSDVHTQSIKADAKSSSTTGADAGPATNKTEDIWVHQLSDMLVAMATVPGFVSYRHPEEGSRFMQKLKEVFLERAATDHLVDMLIEVNNRVCLMETDSNKVQQPEYKISLRKKLYFLPGYPA